MSSLMKLICLFMVHYFKQRIMTSLVNLHPCNQSWLRKQQRKIHCHSLRFYPIKRSFLLKKHTFKKRFLCNRSRKRRRSLRRVVVLTKETQSRKIAMRNMSPRREVFLELTRRFLQWRRKDKMSKKYCKNWNLLSKKRLGLLLPWPRNRKQIMMGWRRLRKTQAS